MGLGPVLVRQLSPGSVADQVWRIFIFLCVRETDRVVIEMVNQTTPTAARPVDGGVVQGEYSPPPVPEQAIRAPDTYRPPPEPPDDADAPAASRAQQSAPLDSPPRSVSSQRDGYTPPPVPGAVNPSTGDSGVASRRRTGAGNTEVRNGDVTAEEESGERLPTEERGHEQVGSTEVSVTDRSIEDDPVEERPVEEHSVEGDVNERIDDRGAEPGDGATVDADDSSDTSTVGVEPSEYTVKELRAELKAIHDDSRLEKVLEREKNGKNRRSAVDAIRSRRRSVGDDDSEGTASSDS